jgi:hypothetical protein
MSVPHRRPRSVDGIPLSRTAQWCAAALVVTVLAAIWHPWSRGSDSEFGFRSIPGPVEKDISKFRDDLAAVLAEEPPNGAHLRDALARIDREPVMWKARLTEHDVEKLQSALTAKLETVSAPR